MMDIVQLPFLGNLFQLPLLPTVLSFLAIYFGYLVYYHRDGSAIGTTPRPELYTVGSPIPLLGNLLEAVRSGKMRDRQLEFWSKERHKMMKKQGGSKVMTVTVPFLRVIDATTPEGVEYLQKTAFNNFEKGWRTFDLLKDALGEGIFGVDGERWIRQRKATAKIFTNSNFKSIISDSIQLDLDHLRQCLDHFADTEEVFDLSSVFYAFTLSSFSRMAFGHHLGIIGKDGIKSVPFATAFDKAQTIMAMRTINPYWKLSEYFSKDGRDMRDACRLMDQFAYGLIDQREMDIKADEKGSHSRSKDLLSLYLAIRDENGQPLSRKALRDSVISLILAGRDTTAQELSWCFFHLISNPSLVDPILAEVNEASTIEYENYRSLSQIQAAFNETLRLHPSVPKSGKTARAEDVLPNGISVERGTFVRFSDWEMGRDESLWGVDASVFRPSRWIIKDGDRDGADENDGADDEEAGLGGVKVRKESQWKLHAFNGGPRVCLGQQLATFEATMVIAAIIRDYSLSFAPEYLSTVEYVDLPHTGERTPRYRTSITLPMHAPMLTIVKRRARD